MRKEIFERNLHLVQITMWELFPGIGAVLEEITQVKSMGYIPIEVPLEILERRAAELGYRFKKLFDGESSKISQALMVAGIKENNGHSIALYKIDGGWWVTNSDFDEFCETFMR